MNQSIMININNSLLKKINKPEIKDYKSLCHDFELVSESDKEPEIEFILETDTDSDPELETESGPESETESIPESETESIPESETEFIPESETESGPEFVPELDDFNGKSLINDSLDDSSLDMYEIDDTSYKAKNYCVKSMKYFAQILKKLPCCKYEINPKKIIAHVPFEDDELIESKDKNESENVTYFPPDEIYKLRGSV